MAHRSRLGGFSIDCRDADLPQAAAFWAAALGDTTPPEPRGSYVELGPQSGLDVEVQSVGHPPRVHLDIETDDVSAEVARLEAHGARVVEQVGDWIVMQAPTGHRFCVVPAQTRDFAAKAKRWEDGA